VEHRQRPQVPGLVVHLRLYDVSQGAQVRPDRDLRWVYITPLGCPVVPEV
jgi:hypothetical protein